jgi:hypothetical protein
MEIKISPRGFKYADFKDLYGNDCSIQESSLATEDAIWLGLDDSRMHLNREQAEHIVELLQKFIDDGSL